MKTPISIRLRNERIIVQQVRDVADKRNDWRAVERLEQADADLRRRIQ